MSRASAHEIIPGKLYQRGKFLTWPYAQKKTFMDSRGITMVVNLWCKVDPDLSSTELGTIYLNWHTSPSQVPELADEMVGTIVAAMRKGHGVLIHCEAGRGRSVWLTCRVVSEYLDISREEALERVLAAGARQSLTPTLRKDLTK